MLEITAICTSVGRPLRSISYDKSGSKNSSSLFLRYHRRLASAMIGKTVSFFNLVTAAQLTLLHQVAVASFPLVIIVVRAIAEGVSAPHPMTSLDQEIGL